MVRYRTNFPDNKALLEGIHWCIHRHVKLPKTEEAAFQFIQRSDGEIDLQFYFWNEESSAWTDNIVRALCGKAHKSEGIPLTTMLSQQKQMLQPLHHELSTNTQARHIREWLFQRAPLPGGENHSRYYEKALLTFLLSLLPNQFSVVHQDQFRNLLETYLRKKVQTRIRQLVLKNSHLMVEAKNKDRGKSRGRERAKSAQVQARSKLPARSKAVRRDMSKGQRFLRPKHDNGR